MIKCTRFITKRIRKRETDKEKKNMEMNQKQYGKDHEKKEREKQTGRYIILAADDETELLDILELYLEREGIGICKAGDGIEAMKIFGREEVHLALLDIMMPGRTIISPSLTIHWKWWRGSRLSSAAAMITGTRRRKRLRCLPCGMW